MEYIDAFPEPKPEKKQLSEKPTIHPTCRIYNSHVGAWTELQKNTTLVESNFGDYSYTAGHVAIIHADVGKFCSIAALVRINPGNHPMHRVMQHHCTYRRIQFGFDTVEDEEFFQWRRDHRCNLGHDVWLGHGAVVMPGVSIGTGAVIGSGAVVTKDIDPYQIAVGVPAKPKRKRFPDKIAEKLQRIAWWDWDRKTLEDRFHDFLDMNAFLEKYDV